jgi:hypothetical protein
MLLACQTAAIVDFDMGRVRHRLGGKRHLLGRCDAILASGDQQGSNLDARQTTAKTTAMEEIRRFGTALATGCGAARPPIGILQYIFQFDLFLF